MSEYTFESLVWDVENKVARVLLIVSMLCEVTLILIYASIDELLNTPGKIVMSISTVLLVSVYVIRITLIFYIRNSL